MHGQKLKAVASGLAALIFLLMAAITHADSAPVTGARAPEFKAVTAAGEEFTFPRAQTGVDLYFFWASWCPFCKAFMPHLQSIEEEYGDQVRIFAFQILDEEDGAEYLDRYGYTFDLIPDSDHVMSAYGVKGTPGLFMVDRHGNIRLNLRELQGITIEGAENMKRFQKAARLGPWWAARIRLRLDEVLAEQSAR